MKYRAFLPHFVSMGGWLVGGFMGWVGGGGVDSLVVWWVVCL